MPAAQCADGVPPLRERSARRSRAARRFGEQLLDLADGPVVGRIGHRGDHGQRIEHAGVVADVVDRAQELARHAARFHRLQQHHRIGRAAPTGGPQQAASIRAPQILQKRVYEQLRDLLRILVPPVGLDQAARETQEADRQFGAEVPLTHEPARLPRQPRRPPADEQPQLQRRPQPHQNLYRPWGLVGGGIGRRRCRSRVRQKCGHTRGFSSGTNSARSRAKYSTTISGTLSPHRAARGGRGDHPTRYDVSARTVLLAAAVRPKNRVCQVIPDRAGLRGPRTSPRRAQKPSLPSCFGSRCQSLATLTCRCR